NGHERASGRRQRVRDRAESRVRRDPLPGGEVWTDELRIVERRAQQPLEDHALRRGLRLELELDPGQMVERRDERTLGKVLEREPPPFLFLTGRPCAGREALECLEPRVAKPSGLFAPETVLLDRLTVEQQRDRYELGRTSQWRLASTA